ncbi:response regulator [Ruminococcaceae bacterium OttesenSCG-928-D13]|nr:response regulator [Ruminococcaceae bacterium OttesenSCG-928-D13]
MERRLNVVVVEDEPIILRYVAKKLEEQDPDLHVALAVDDPQAALAHMLAQPPDILFTDIEMPGMSGLDLIRQVRGHYPLLPVVILSGYSNFAYAQAALRYGVFDYLLKPVESADLKAALERTRAVIMEQRGLEAIRTQRLAESQAEQQPLMDRREQSGITGQIEQYMATHFNQPLTIADIAAHFSYSPTYVNRLFKRQYGVSPIQYQITLRIDKAKALLREFPKASIKDIAAAVGYDDARYFSRVFRLSEGLSPSEYAEQNHTAARPNGG